MWYSRTGEGEPLLLLHPGSADARAFDNIVPTLAQLFTCYLPERRGHGHTPDVEGAYDFNAVVDDKIAFIETVIQGPVRVFGYSDGAIVAIMLAVKRPDLVSRLVCGSGVYHHDGWLSGVIDDSETPPDFMTEAYAEVSPDGKEHYAVVIKKLADAHRAQPAITNEELQRVLCRTLVILGDDDEVKLEHALDWYRALPDGELAIVPRTSHALIVEKTELYLSIVADFLRNEPIETFAPIRRK